MNTSDFYYDLPEKLIAQSPLKDRTASRLLILDRNTGKTTHTHFKSIIDYLNEGDCLVINETKVIPARIFGCKKGTNSQVELLLLKRLEDDKWETLVSPGKRARIGDEIEFGDGLLSCIVKDIVDDGNRIVEFSYNGIFEEILDKLGEMPLPPYITEKLEEKDRYQTVYAKNEGSAAAPTAGLHFTNELLEEIEKKGIKIARITLHVGLGTFRPVKVDNVKEHKMHSEFYSVEREQADIINTAKKSGKKVIAVGTTSVRTLEACTVNGELQAGEGDTEIFIYPGYDFKMIDGLITNFHLPESTLIMLVSALSNREHILNAYNEAVSMEYRFFSFGDAMFITNLGDTN